MICYNYYGGTMKKRYMIIIIIALILTISYLHNSQLPRQKHFIHGDKIIVKKDKLVEFKNNNYKINKTIQKDPRKGLYSKKFIKNKVNEIRISIPKNNYNYLLQNAKDKPKVLINDIKINNDKLKYASMTTKGASTLYPIVTSNNDRFSYTINFNKYINKKNGYSDNQNFYGLNKLSLNNMLGDPSLIKEYLSYYLLTEMKVPTPEYAYTKLYINNKYQGLYFMLEPIDTSLSMRTLNQDNNFIVKPKKNGGTLIYNNELDNYIDNNGNFDFSKILYDKNGNVIEPKNNILEKYNGIWENDIDTLNNIHKDLPTFFKWLKRLNELNNLEDKNTEYYEEELNKIIDVDSLMRYWAANVYLVNSDSYSSITVENYALHMSKDGYVTIIPWDYNYTFGAIHMLNTNNVINYNIYDPTIGCKIGDRPLINIILGNDNLKNKYLKYIEDTLIITTSGGKTSDGKKYPKNNFNKIIDNKSKEIISLEKRDNQYFYTSKEIKIAQKNLKEVIKLRSKAINKQLNNDFTPIDSNIKLMSMGGFHSVLGNHWNRFPK